VVQLLPRHTEVARNLAQRRRPDLVLPGVEVQVNHVTDRRLAALGGLACCLILAEHRVGEMALCGLPGVGQRYFAHVAEADAPLATVEPVLRYVAPHLTTDPDAEPGHGVVEEDGIRLVRGEAEDIVLVELHVAPWKHLGSNSMVLADVPCSLATEGVAQKS